MASADTRTTHTDALTVLGTLIDETIGRDAIHLAVEPVIAGMTLKPGERITFFDGDTTTAVLEDLMSTGKALGIVDPFLPKPVKKGERFLMILLPGQIATLRHVWDHPRFAPASTGGVDLGVAPAAAPPIQITNAAPAAKAWLENFANENGVSYQQLISDTLDWSRNDNEPWWVSASEDYDDFWSNMDALLGCTLDRGTIDLSCRGC